MIANNDPNENATNINPLSLSFSCKRSGSQKTKQRRKISNTIKKKNINKINLKINTP